MAGHLCEEFGRRFTLQNWIEMVRSHAGRAWRRPMTGSPQADQELDNVKLELLCWLGLCHCSAQLLPWQRRSLQGLPCCLGPRAHLQTPVSQQTIRPSARGTKPRRLVSYHHQAVDDASFELTDCGPSLHNWHLPQAIPTTNLADLTQRGRDRVIMCCGLPMEQNA